MNSFPHSRRRFVRDLGVSAAALPFLTGLPGLSASSASSKKRLIFMFSPNGTIPANFWPDNQGTDYDLKRILKPLAPFQSEVMPLRGINNKVGGDGDRHMRGMSCLLTGTELLPGNIQGGSDTLQDGRAAFPLTRNCGTSIKAGKKHEPDLAPSNSG